LHSFLRHGVYNHDTSTSQTDGRTDRLTDEQTTCHGNTAFCIASRGFKLLVVKLN